MLYHLFYPLHELFGGFNVFRYITFRSIGATITSFVLVLLVAPVFIRFLQHLQIGQVIRKDGPATHFTKQGVPTMGGILILFAVSLSTLLWVDWTNYYVWIVLAVTLWYG
ncbi:MAG: phospho-N-acetylmuramoyl-pentapeptide-transferase, partial [Desulfobulbaceae bacterium]|nr:phospho-N-acetylmuramoyl-pentapeptide-transferase [Desulfobulbaceae bacterium]